ncbi:flagellar hook protein FlgE [Aromatoleum bremense]|uniref:Flagellar hook protein FlgE n=1 Tax=Aromatoleum bremense TaxID=76115 RepID=A0ABX1P0P6_9RHOO|nr:flagellar hook protein FlgE [Aromatoleum bremense]NMG17613.1 flagellar hook-basal body complex protein [Aromatoleum bremense]QTQ30887.1 Flagellar hook-basal body protein [Aromatoleum bremense]
MAFQQGLSGLASASKALDVISNNVANSNTIGFKAGRAEFADVFAASFNGTGGNSQVGIGTTIAAVSQNFSQGNVTVTNNPLDLAINGNGFFRVSAPDGTEAFTRNGQFDISKDGFIVNAQGYRLSGYGADVNGDILTGVVSDIVVNPSLAGGAPQQTGVSQRPLPDNTAGLSLGVNLDSRQHLPEKPKFSAADPKSYNNATSATLYDSLGNPKTLTMYFVRNGTRADPAASPPKLEEVKNDWTVHYQLDGKDIGNPTFNHTLSFNTGGVLTTSLPVTGPAFKDLFGDNLVPGLETPALRIDFSGTTQYGGEFGINVPSDQDGFAPGRLTGVSVGDDGVIEGRYSNGQSRDLGQVVLANFRSPNGLVSLGGNMWAQSPASGPSSVGVPGSANLGLLNAGAVEEANVDLTAELVQLIVQQRNYQANAQSVQAQNTILQTIVNLG